MPQASRTITTREAVGGSFRDPSGFLFVHNGSIYRQVNLSYKENYDHLMNSGLYRDLVDSQLLVRHEESDSNSAASPAYKILKPEPIPFVSYPYEWCFTQLKRAALATLEIQKRALAFGMSLKDSSAYNIQFVHGKPILIDTLSFEKYRQGAPWVAYRQFCQHFVCPLALMSYTDIRLHQLLRIYVDGIPLDLASSLLPLRTRFAFSLFSHIHLHAKSQKHFGNKAVDTRGRKMSLLAHKGLLESLESAVKKLKWQVTGTEWENYYDETNYSSAALLHKKEVVAQFLEAINPRTVWDLGANTGLFSRIASGKGIQTIAFDVDPACVEKNYRACLEQEETRILPLVLDLTNPSPSIGWANQERMALTERAPADAVLALALIHHLAIGNNVPLPRTAEFFHGLCNSLVIEFVPKTDSQVRRLLSSREDVFPDYTQQSFERSFAQFFQISDSVKIQDSERTLYRMQKLPT